MKKIKVTQCSDCPFEYDDWYCSINDEKPFQDGEDLPKWCPLKNGPIIVELEQEQ